MLKYGTALGRSVDLTRFDGYEDLIRELDHMFDFNGRLIDRSSGWHVTYTDDEGDMMLIGDCPWQLSPKLNTILFKTPHPSNSPKNVCNQILV